MEQRLAFLLYDNRSGSTLLAALLNRYSGITVSQESTFISQIIEYDGPLLTDRIEEILHELSKEIQFRELDFNTEEFIKELKEHREGIISKKEFINLILKRYFNDRDSDARLRVVKQGDYLYIKEILEMFPESMFLQIVRDGRAVFNSKKRTISFGGGMQETNPLSAAWNWTHKLRKADFYKKKVVTIRYEDLVMNPDATLETILDQLKIPSSLRKKTKTQKEYFYELGPRQKPLHKNIEKKPQEKFVYKWKDQLSKKEIIVYTYWSNMYLDKYGYETFESSLVSIYLYSFQYFMQYLLNTSIQIIKLLKNPSSLRKKIKRNFRLIVGR